MGMYTRLVLNVAIKDTATACVAEIQAMIDGNGTHEGRRAWLLGSSSYYHDNINCQRFEHDDVAHTWKLSVCCDVKNYESEIEWFLNFIAPHVETDELAGYVRYEENRAPDLVWFINGVLVQHTPTLPPELL